MVIRDYGLFVLGLLLFLSATGQQQQVTNIQGVTVQTSKRKEPSKMIPLLGLSDFKTPMAIVSVDSLQMLLQNPQTITRATAGIAAVRPINRYGGFQTFRIRGFNNIVVLIDGIRDERHNLANSAPTTNLANIASISVLKGAAAALVGHAALGGVIHLERKKPQSKKRLEGVVSAGSFDHYRVQLGGTGRLLKGLNYRLDVGVSDEQGWRDMLTKTKNIGFSLDHQLDTRQNIRVYLQYNDDVYGTETGILVDKQSKPMATAMIQTRYNSPSDYLKHKRFDLQIRYRYRWNQHTALVNTFSYYDDDIDYLSTEELSINQTKDTITRSFPFGFNHHTKPLQNNLQFQFRTTKGIPTKNVIGYTLSILDRKTFQANIKGAGLHAKVSLKNPRLNQGGVYKEDKRVDGKMETAHAFYLQSWLDVSARLKALVSARVDFFKGSYRQDLIRANRTVYQYGTTAVIEKPIFNTRLSAIYDLIPQKTNVYVAYANYFRPNRRIVEGKVFQPEKGFQLELGGKWRAGRIAFDGSMYHITKENIVQRNRANVFQPIGTAQSKGLELAVNYQKNTLKLATSYAYNRTEVTSEGQFKGNQLLFNPVHTLTFSLDTPLTQKHEVHLGLNGRYVAENYTNAANTYQLPAYMVFNAYFVYLFDSKSSLQLNIDNLFNERYYTDAIFGNQFFVAPNRNIRLTFRQAF